MAKHPEGRAPTLAASRSRRSLVRIDQRTWTGRRIAELTKEYAAILGNPDDPVTQMSIRSAAELTTLCELRRAQLLTSEDASTFELDRLIRLEGTTSRKLRQLGLSSGPRSQPKVGLSEYLASKRERTG